MADPLWRPSDERIAATALTRFIETEARGRWGASASDYADLHRWSVARREEFWQSVWSFGKEIGRAHV